MSKIKHMHSVSRLRELFDYEPSSGIVTRRATGTPIGTLFSTGHLQASADGVITGVHRIAFALLTGEYPAMEVDHINGNGADNRASNLRLATSYQNNQNRRLGTRNKSGVKGVFQVHTEGRLYWRVAIGAYGKYHIRQFKSFEEAVAYAEVKRHELHGEFARAS